MKTFIPQFLETICQLGFTLTKQRLTFVTTYGYKRGNCTPMLELWSPSDMQDRYSYLPFYLWDNCCVYNGGWLYYIKFDLSEPFRQSREFQYYMLSGIATEITIDIDAGNLTNLELYHEKTC